MAFVEFPLHDDEDFPAGPEDPHLEVLNPHIQVGGRALLSVDAAGATILGLALAAHGAVTAWLMVRNASDLAEERRGRLMWGNLYVLMMEAQIGVAVLYLTSG